MQLLSKYNPIFKILPQIFLGIIGIGFLLSFSWNIEGLRIYFEYILVLCLVIAGLAFCRIRLTYLELYQVFFNTDSLIFKNKLSEREGYNSNLLVKYTDIISVVKVSSQFSILGFRYSNYNIIFNKEGRGKDIQNFHVLPWSQAFLQFKSLAEKANPNLNIIRNELDFL